MVKTEIKKIHKTEASSKAMRPFRASNSNEKNNNNKNKKYKGVRMRSWGSWVSEIRAPNQKTRIWLGSYSTAEAAARAYDAALLCLKGSSANANLNFPSSSSLYIPQDTVLSLKSIQRVAAAAANNNTFEDNNNNATVSIVTNSTSSSSNSSLVSSPSSMSSSSPNSDCQIDDDVSLISPFDQPPNESMAMMESWYGLEYGLESPKYFDQMLSGTFFDIDSTHLLDDLYEESDISLWSFS